MQRGSSFGVGALALTDALLVTSAIGAADAAVLFYKLPAHDAPFALGRPFCNVRPNAASAGGAALRRLAQHSRTAKHAARSMRRAV